MPSALDTSTKKSRKEKDKKPWYILKDSQGQGSVTVTLMLVSFWITTFSYIASALGKIGDVEFKDFDSAAAGAYLIPILTLYFGRKWTDSKIIKTEELKEEKLED